MIRQQHPGIDAERKSRPYPFDTLAQRRTNIVIEQESLSLERIDGKEIRGARRLGAAVIGHVSIVSCPLLRLKNLSALP